jgi:hypothetical protein
MIYKIRNDGRIITQAHLDQFQYPHYRFKTIYAHQLQEKDKIMGWSKMVDGVLLHKASEIKSIVQREEGVIIHFAPRRKSEFFFRYQTLMILQ